MFSLWIALDIPILLRGVVWCSTLDYKIYIKILLFTEMYDEMYDENYDVITPMTINIRANSYKLDENANKMHK